MHDIFISQDDTFTISFAMAKDNNGKLLIDKDSESLKNNYGMLIGENDITEHSVTFRVPSFKDHVKMQGEGLTASADGKNVEVNVWKLRLTRIATLLKSWSLRDGKGKKVDPKMENVEQLNPIIASYLSDEIDDYLGVV